MRKSWEDFGFAIRIGEYRKCLLQGNLRPKEYLATPRVASNIMKIFTVLFLLLLLPAAAAYEESQAARVRMLERGVADVVAVWHEPEIVQPGTQWNGFIQFQEGHGIQNITFQICDVGRVCFAPPSPVQRLNETTWSFDTESYQRIGKAINYEAGWRLGTQFILTERMANGTLETYKFPEGIEEPDDLEFHYFAFDMPEATNKGIPALNTLPTLVALAAAGFIRKRA